MTLAKTLLEKLTNWRPEPGRQTLHVDDAASGWSATLTADRSDELGCLIWDLKLFRAFGPSDASGLPAWAERIAARVTGLVEPFKVIEIDTDRGEGFLRSQAPMSRGESSYHYEVFLRGTREASVRRYEAANHGQGKREQVVFPLTHETLVKVVGDLVATA